jgi:hypothetical protein
MKRWILRAIIFMYLLILLVGFFDFLHGQTGVAPNGIELHAVLDIQFGTGETPTPTPTNTPILTVLRNLPI